MPAFRPFSEARLATLAERDTLQAIADRECAEGNDITEEDIALFNWGARESMHVQELMRDELGARWRASPMEYVLSPDDQPREALRIPERFEKDGLATNRTHTLRIRRRTCSDQFIGCCSLPSITFPLNSSFVRPDVAESLGAVEELIARQPDSKLMVFGHTDAVGDLGYNKRLSERRAWSVYAFILNDAEAWETLYNHPDEEWGVAVVQEILTDLGHDTGAVDGDLGPATRGGMRAFLGLPEGAPVANDPAFRTQLFAAYMGGKHDIKVEEDRFLTSGYMGCGEFNLLEDSDATNPRNRRVTIYAFHKERPPSLPCAFNDVAPCQRQMVDTVHRHQPGFACSFYDSLAGHCSGEGLRLLDVYLLDRDGHAMADCSFRVRKESAVLVEGVTDGTGLATLPDSMPHVVEIDWARPDSPGAPDGSYLFTGSYVVSVSAPQTRSGCSVRLKNLGFQGEEFEGLRAGAASFLGAHFATPFNRFANDIDAWHSTGDPTHISPEEPESEDEEEENEFVVDDEGWFDDVED